jgi:hypothetical protein
MWRIGLLFILSVVNAALFAAEPTGIGAVANNLMGPVTYLSDFIYTACMILGFSFIFASVIKYLEHKRSPLAVPMSTFVFLLVAGLGLISLPFAYRLLHYGSPYTLFQASGTS